MPNVTIGSLMKRAIAVWLILIAVEFVHGMLRTVFLVAYVGDFRARQIGVFIGSALIVLIAYLFTGWLQATSTRALLLVGVLWLLLTVAFELVFGHFVFGRSWASLREDYNLVRGGLLPLGLLVLVLSPAIAAWMRHRPAPQ
jgi:hypothetical protein